MLRLADVLRRHGPDYLQRHGDRVLPSHARAVRAITQCRTAALGGHLAECTQCAGSHVLFHSCRHRACPRCGHDAASRWLRHQQSLLLPVRYFHVVFTLPAELRRAVRTHQRVLLSVLFKAAFESLSALCADPRFVGGRIGALAVLHTWTRTLEWHPHVHMLVPAGALGSDGRTWRSPKDRRKPFLVPVRALSAHFRGRFLSLGRAALPPQTLPSVPWNKRWVVFAKPAVRGAERVLQYLGRYVHRTALTDKAIVGCDERSVSITYRHSADGQTRCMTLPAHELLRRFLQHVPAKGLHRVRAFGLLHPAHRATLRQLQLTLAQDARAPAADRTADDDSPPAHPLRCPRCHTPTLRLLLRLSVEQCFAWAHANAIGIERCARAPPPSAAGLA
jgi:hypothetical protein